MTSLNEQLKALYESTWDTFAKALKESNAKVAYPFLLSTNKYENGSNIPSEKWYTNADVKVMVFGQEPNKWMQDEESVKSGDCESKIQFFAGSEPETVECIMGIYENQYSNYGFDEIGRELYFHKNNKTFPNLGCNNFTSQLYEKIRNKVIACIWNDISKLATIDGKPITTDVHDIEKKYFNVIPKEIEILKPDIIVFLTGGESHYIEEKYSNIRYEQICEEYEVKDVARIYGIPDVDLAYRTWHPGAYYKDGKPYYRCVEAIVADVIKNLKL